MSSLPLWVEYARALGPLCVAIAVGGIGAYIAWRQWRTNENNLREKLFERRFELFRDAQRVMSEVVREGRADWDLGAKFSDAAQQSRFMFSTEDADYFDLLRRKALELARFTTEMDSSDQNVKQTAIEKNHEISVWFSDQFDVLFDRMEKYLKFE